MEVDIYFKDPQPNHGNEGVQRLQRIWRNSTTEELKINGKNVTQSAFDDFIEGLGLNYSNPYNIIQQGKISHITLMNEAELNDLLEEAVGLRKFQTRLDEAGKEMLHSQKLRQECMETIEELKEKMSGLETRREEF